MKRGIAFLLMSLTCSPALAATSLPVGKCVNTANMLETSRTESSWGGKKLDADDFRRMRAAGFATVRIPVNWYAHPGTKPGQAVDPKWLKRVGLAVDQALASGLNVVLNSHYFEPIHADPERGAPLLAKVWSEVATHFRTRPNTRLWFEIENEPHDKLTNANLKASFAPALAAIRKSNPLRPVIIGGENWSGVDSLATLELPDDPNIHPTFHYYEPFDFTHQGADWVKPTFPLGRQYGSDADKVRLAADLAKVKAYIARTGRTPFMGETGAYDRAPLDQRIAYHTAIDQAFAGTGVGICAWGYTNSFPFWDQKTRSWLPGLLEAFGLPATSRK